jgi:hypothetical protein
MAHRRRLPRRMAHGTRRVSLQRRATRSGAERYEVEVV